MTDGSVNIDMRRWVYACWLNVLDALYPPTCRLCLAPGLPRLDLCGGCRADLPRLAAHCERCAAPLPIAAASCGACLRRTPAFDRTLAAFRYAHPIDWLVHDFKFRGRLSTGRLLGDLLGETMHRRREKPPELLIPVPLHPARLAERGFNQSLEIARRVGRRLGVPVQAHSLVRNRATPAQHGLPAKSRAANVRNAFTLNGPITARRVAIVDDVMTTGNTVGECARVLKRAGVEQVEVWVVARA